MLASKVGQGLDFAQYVSMIPCALAGRQLGSGSADVATQKVAATPKTEQGKDADSNTCHERVHPTFSQSCVKVLAKTITTAIVLRHGCMVDIGCKGY